jgi:hypothetical protein
MHSCPLRVSYTTSTDLAITSSLLRLRVQAIGLAKRTAIKAPPSVDNFGKFLASEADLRAFYKSEDPWPVAWVPLYAALHRTNTKSTQVVLYDGCERDEPHDASTGFIMLFDIGGNKFAAGDYSIDRHELRVWNDHAGVEDEEVRRKAVLAASHPSCRPAFALNIPFLLQQHRLLKPKLKPVPAHADKSISVIHVNVSIRFSLPICPIVMPCTGQFQSRDLGRG